MIRDAFDAIALEPRLSTAELAAYVERCADEVRSAVAVLLARGHVRAEVVGGLSSTPLGRSFYALASPAPLIGSFSYRAEATQQPDPECGDALAVSLWQCAETM